MTNCFDYAQVSVHLPGHPGAFVTCTIAVDGATSAAGSDSCPSVRTIRAFDVSGEKSYPSGGRAYGGGRGRLSDGGGASERTTSTTCRPTVYLAEFSSWSWGKRQNNVDSAMWKMSKDWSYIRLAPRKSFDILALYKSDYYYYYYYYRIRGYAKVFRPEGRRSLAGMLIPRKSHSWVSIGQSRDSTETQFGPGGATISVSWYNARMLKRASLTVPSCWHPNKVAGNSSHRQIYWFGVMPPTQYVDGQTVVNRHQSVLIKVIPLIGSDTLLHCCWLRHSPYCRFVGQQSHQR